MGEGVWIGGDGVWLGDAQVKPRGLDLCQVAITSLGPHHNCPLNPHYASGQQLQSVRGLTLQISKDRLHATAGYISSQDTAPGQDSTQLDGNTADLYH